MGNSASIQYIVMKKGRPSASLRDTLADAMGTSLSLDAPVFLQVGPADFIEVDGSVAIDTIEATCRHCSLPTGGY